MERGSALRVLWVAGAMAVASTLVSGTTMADTASFTGSLDANSTNWRAHRFDVGAPGSIDANLDWNNASANLNLFLFDPSGALVALAISTTAKPETITYSATVTGTWKLGVKAKSGAASYTLTAEYPGWVWSGLSAVDLAASAGIAQITRSYGTYVHDYDLDGDQDFLYNRHWGSEMILYANDGDGHFHNAPGLFPINDRHDCAWGDVDTNGLPDAYCTHGATSPSGAGLVKANELWIQGEDHTFGSVPGAGGADDPLGRGREPVLFDANKDGLLDLFVGNHYPRPDGQPTPNRFYLGTPDGSFVSAPEYGIDLEIGGQCAEPADFDTDGFTDLMVCAYGPPGGLKLYRNDAGVSFTDVAASKGITDQWCDALWVDLDLDGRVDLTRMNRNTFEVMLQREDGTFNTVYQMSMNKAGCLFGGGGNRVAAGDVNLDGYPDLYVLYSGYTYPNYNLPDVFLVNDGTGMRFAGASLPQTTQGSGFSVTPIDADADPRTEFLVTNGRARFRGPIQLIDFGA